MLQANLAGSAYFKNTMKLPQICSYLASDWHGIYSSNYEEKERRSRCHLPRRHPLPFDVLLSRYIRQRDHRIKGSNHD